MGLDPMVDPVAVAAGNGPARVIIITSKEEVVKVSTEAAPILIVVGDHVGITMTLGGGPKENAATFTIGLLSEPAGKGIREEFHIADDAPKPENLGT